MRNKVKVTLRCEEEVEIEVGHEPDEDPCDLTEEEEQEAIKNGSSFPDWEVDDVEVKRVKE